jgi:hypothetical protein
MSPPLFRNIYLGALGEVVGRAIFERWGVRLSELDQNRFELFDYKIDDDTLVDFKHWKGSENVPLDETIKKILEKMDRANVSCVFIVNILKRKHADDKKIVKTIHGGKTIIEIPFLFDSKNQTWNDEAFRLLTQWVKK